MAHVYEAYEEVKRGQGRMDMEDVLLLNAGMLAEDERVAAEVRRQYKWFVVDEFQDVSPLQYALLELWLGGREEICVVGDPAPDDLLLRRRRRALPARLRHPVPAGDLGRPGAQLPLQPPGRRVAANACWPGP